MAFEGVGSTGRDKSVDPMSLPPAPIGTDLIDIDALMRVARRRFVLFVFCTTLVFLAAAAYVLNLTPRYTATATFQINPNQQDIIGLSPFTPGGMNASAVDTEVAIITSADLLRRVVRALDLQFDPEFNPDLGDDIGVVRVSLNDVGNVSTAAGVLIADDAAAASPAGPVVSDADLLLDAGGRTDAQELEAVKTAASALSKRVRAERVNLTYLINVSVESENPASAAAIANALVDQYIKRQLETKYETARSATDFLSERVTALREEVEATESAVVAYQQAEGLLDFGGSTLGEEQIKSINTQLIIARSDLAASEARLRTLQSRLNRGESADTIAEVLSSNVIRDLRQQQAQVGRRQAELRVDLGPRHPDMIRVNREFADLEVQIDEEVNRIVESYRNERTVLAERVRSLESDLKRAEVALGENNQSLVRLRELQRSAEATRALYESFLNRLKQSSEATEVEQANAELVSAATAPGAPSFPNNKLMLLASVVVSVGFGVGMVVVAELLDSGFRTSEELERLVGGRVVAGSIPLLRKAEAKVDKQKVDLPDYVLLRPFSAIAESFRALKAAVVLPHAEAGSQVVIMTSGLPGEGKTSTSFAFSRMLAMSGTKVLIVDGDLRQRSLSQRVAADHKNGLMEVLAGKVSLDDAVITDESGADVLTVSPVYYTQRDVFGLKAFEELLADMRTRYEVIVFDTAPLLAVADTLTLSRLADIVVVLVRWAHTKREVVRSTFAELRKVRIKAAALVMSQVNTQRRELYDGVQTVEYSRYYSS